MNIRIRERKSAGGRITHLGNARVMRADPASNKNGTNTEGSRAMILSESLEREGGNATAGKGTEFSFGCEAKTIMACVQQSHKAVED